MKTQLTELERDIKDLLMQADSYEVTGKVYFDWAHEARQQATKLTEQLLITEDIEY